MYICNRKWQKNCDDWRCRFYQMKIIEILLYWSGLNKIWAIYVACPSNFVIPNKSLLFNSSLNTVSCWIFADKMPLFSIDI